MIDRAGNRLALSWADHVAVWRVLSDDPDSGVIHLHGHWREPETVVLGSASYRAHAADERRDFIQKMATLQRPTVFVGCSADGLADPDFGRLAAWVQSMNSMAARRYWLVPKAKLMTPYPSSRLYGVPFGDHHSELPGFILGLAPSRVSSLPRIHG